MNHYTTLTASTLPGANHHTWQSEIPREAVAYPFLTHQILAISVFHLASLDSSQRQTHLSRAFQHQHHAICRIKQEISDITPSNRQALFVASSLLFIGAFASTSQATTRLCQREVDSILGIFTLVRGVSGILSSSKENNRHGILGKFKQCDSPPKRTRLLGLLLEELPRTRERFARDRHMSHEAKALAGEAIDGLRESAGRAAAAATELTVAIVWPMTLSDGFLTLLRVHHPVALVVVAHYCTVLCAAGSEFWFMRGWERHIVDAVAESLMPSWHEAIRWPLAFIKSSETSGSQGQDTLRLEPSDPRRGQELEAAM